MRAMLEELAACDMRATLGPNKPTSSHGRQRDLHNAVAVQPISLLGSTGSIGTQTLDICGEFHDRFDVVGLAAGSNITLLAEQIKQFQPQIVAIQSDKDIEPLKDLIKDAPKQPEIMVGVEGQCAVAAHPDIEAVVTGIVGCAGLKPTCAAIEAGKDICLANKETLIAGGPAVLPLAAKHGVHILPADSEHSALFQCIQGLPEGGLRRIILTASGGAFRDRPVDTLKDVTVCTLLALFARACMTRPFELRRFQQTCSPAGVCCCGFAFVTLLHALSGFRAARNCLRAVSNMCHRQLIERSCTTRCVQMLCVQPSHTFVCGAGSRRVLASQLVDGSQDHG